MEVGVIFLEENIGCILVTCLVLSIVLLLNS